MKFAIGMMTALFILLVGAGFSYSHFSRASNKGVVINEVLVGSNGQARREFIELYNNNEEAVDLAGWSLKKKTAGGSESVLVNAAKFIGQIPGKGYFLVAPSEYLGEFGADLAYSGSSYSIATNNSVLLYDADNKAVDRVGWGAAADFEGAPAPDPGVGQSIARVPDGQDSDDNAADFAVGSPSPRGKGGSSGDPGFGESQAEQDSISVQPADTVKRYHFGAVLINEFVADPADNDTEWVELANAMPETVALSGWTLEDGSGVKTFLSGTLEASGQKKYQVVNKPKAALNNGGDLIILRDFFGAAIDSVAYGDWADGNPDDNAPVHRDPDSVGRCPDGVNSRQNNADFRILKNKTKGGANDCSAASLVEATPADGSANSQSAVVPSVLPPGLKFSEALPDPAGVDAAGEFIELYNSSQETVDICGWRLGDASNKRYLLKPEKSECRIAPGAYFLVKRQDSGLALNNDQDAIRLFAPAGDSPFLSIEYSGAREGLAFACLDEKGAAITPCAWTKEPTPGQANRIVRANRPPKPDFVLPEGAQAGREVVFDASDSSDEDEDKLSFLWDFGDGAKSDWSRAGHVYALAGDYQVVLSVGDGQSTSTMKKKLSVAPAVVNVSAEDGDWKIIINEFMPDPHGSDDEEWIELYNNGAVRASLAGWRLDDAEGGSKPFTVKDAIWIEAGAYYVFERGETKLALNNNEDAVRLFDPDGILVDAAEYSGAKEGLAYARAANGAWTWTVSPTPGGSNAFKSPLAAVKGAKPASTKKASVNYKSINLKDARFLDSGDDVIARGWVAVLPGVLGSQFFYIHDQEGGVQIYSYKKDFPPLKIGDFIEARGEIGITNNERRVKTKTRADISIVKTESDCPEPVKVKCEELGEELVGRLVTVAGEVSERKSASIRLDDGTGEGAVYIKSATGVNAGRFRTGDKLEVIGIVSLSGDGARVLPRSNADIALMRDLSGNNVLGAVATSSEWDLPARESRFGWYYGFVAAGFIMSLIGWYIWKWKIKRSL